MKLKPETVNAIDQAVLVVDLIERRVTEARNAALEEAAQMTEAYLPGVYEEMAPLERATFMGTRAAIATIIRALKDA